MVRNQGGVSITRNDIHLVNSTVTSGVVVGYKASGDVRQPTVAPNAGVVIRATKNLPISEIESLNVPNEVGGGGTTYNICSGGSCRDCTIRRQSANSVCQEVR